MKNLAIAAACVFASAVYAAPPTDASLERLLAATRDVLAEAGVRQDDAR